MTVYVLTEEGNWGCEFIFNNVKVFDTFEKAKAEFIKLVHKNNKDLCDWSGNLVKKHILDEEKQRAIFNIYELNNYSRLHTVIEIIKKEVE